MRAQKITKDKPKKNARVPSNRMGVNKQLRQAVSLQLLGTEELIILEEQLKLCETVEYLSNEQ